MWSVSGQQLHNIQFSEFSRCRHPFARIVTLPVAQVKVKIPISILCNTISHFYTWVWQLDNTYKVVQKRKFTKVYKYPTRSL